MSMDAQRLDLVIEGMTCSACSARLERVLNAATGVTSAVVNLALERATVRIDPGQAGLDTVIGIVRRCGFDVGTETGTYHVDNLGDARVAGRVEQALSAIPGVLSVRVSRTLERVEVSSVSLMVPDRALASVVADAGHELLPEAAGESGSALRERRQDTRERRAILAAAVLTVPFLFQMVAMFGFGEKAAHLHLPPWLELALATPLQFVLGMRFYRGAFNSLRGGSANMDVLVALGTSAAYAYSLWQMLALGEAARGLLYFEASAIIITLIMVGKHMEARAKRGAAAAIRSLAALRPDTATVRLADGTLTERPPQDLKVGDVIVCRPGDRIAADGTVLRGAAEVDESLITGESNPLSKAPGDPVTAGSINVDGFIDVETRAVGEDSTLSRLIQLVENAQVAKPAVQRLVDRVSGVFVPVVVALAVATFIAWWLSGAGFETALITAAATLVIACPCALGLATPTAIMTGSSAAARAGILIKDITTLELAHGLTHVVFDKTGTLTEGKPRLSEIEVLAGLDEEQVLVAAASLQQGSEHPIALAFRDKMERSGLQMETVENFRSVVSQGIEGELGGRHYMVGNDRLFRHRNLHPPDREMRRGGTEVWLGVALEDRDALLARFTLVDELRPTSRMAIEQLKKLNVVPLLVSGDAVPVAERIADDLAIGDVHGEARPEDKVTIIAALEKDGAKVGMVGDGVNDAPALAQATVGIAMGSGTDVAMDTASITLMRPDPRLVAGAIDISRRTFRKIKQNLFWAFIYNVVGLPLAATGFLSPSLAGAAMAFSSVSVVTNSLFLRSWRPNLGKSDG